MSPEYLLKKGLRRIGLSSSARQVELFMTYLAELKKWNRVYNLTGLRTDEDIIIRHFLDSLLYLKAIPEGGLSIADVGSGAGFPGIPIKIMRPDIQLALIESSRKRSAFLRHIIRILRLDKTNVY
ncbi:MAG: 16S rRNA (guanine(527)-N(7))-methyltransferase RsmG, partial [Candidatus Anstonellales archaeon]